MIIAFRDERGASHRNTQRVHHTYPPPDEAENACSDQLFSTISQLFFLWPYVHTALLTSMPCASVARKTVISASDVILQVTLICI